MINISNNIISIRAHAAAHMSVCALACILVALTRCSLTLMRP